MCPTGQRCGITYSWNTFLLIHQSPCSICATTFSYSMVRNCTRPSEALEKHQPGDYGKMTFTKCAPALDRQWHIPPWRHLDIGIHANSVKWTFSSTKTLHPMQNANRIHSVHITTFARKFKSYFRWANTASDAVRLPLNAYTVIRGARLRAHSNVRHFMFFICIFRSPSECVCFCTSLSLYFTRIRLFNSIQIVIMYVAVNASQ